MAEIARRVRITGRVQGVGYRAWVAREAGRRGLRGSVRNRHDGSVEAVFSGDAATVDAMMAACRQGPPRALVVAVQAVDYAGEPFTGFSVLPTV